MLYQIEPLDPAVIGSAVLLFAVIAVCSSLLPSLRASRIDPMAALRSE
jgi:ABC-type antimicrobial peptide transport system permease subunit